MRSPSGEQHLCILLAPTGVADFYPHPECTGFQKRTVFIDRATHGLYWPCNSIVPSVRWVEYWLVSGEIPVMGGMNGVERRS